jgi:hypothetical protein
MPREVTKGMVALYEEMSRISEQEYCAGWIDGLDGSIAILRTLRLRPSMM